MKKVFGFLAGLFFVFANQPASAQKLEDYVSIHAPAKWIQIQANPEITIKEENSLDISYLLVDRQRQILKASSERYFRYVEALNTSNGVENNSTVEIGFDPAYQVVVIHEIALIRDGQRLDRLNASELQIFRLETDRDKLLYNGDLQVSLILPDVQVGDVLDYSFSISGRNPALGTNFLNRFTQKYSTPVRRLFNRIVIGDSIPRYKKAHAGAVDPVERQLHGKKEYVWDFENQSAIIFDDGRPNWFFMAPTYEISSFETWSDVSQFFAPYYQTPTRLSPELKSVVCEIQLKYKTPEEQAREALNFVQREVRYLGIELGEGGYIPRSAQTTLKRRFGDCKDMTLLLLTLFSELDIDASPLLVNAAERAGVAVNIPSYGVFDHVIVLATINGKQYFLDPTRGEQLGQLDTLEQGQFGKGLPLTKRGSDLVEVSPKGHQWNKDFIDTFDLISNPDAVGFSAIFKYFGGEADGMISWLQRDGKDVIEQSFLDYFKDTFPTIKTVKPMEVNISNDDALVEFSMQYTIPNAWKKVPGRSKIEFETYPYELQADIPDFVGATRTSPFTINHPTKIRQIQTFLMDETWEMEDHSEQVENESFFYSRVSKFKNQKYTDVYEYRSKADEISASNYAEIMEQIRIIRNETGLVLKKPTGFLSTL